MVRRSALSRALGILLALGALAVPALARWTHVAPVQAPLGQPLRLEFLDPEAMAAPLEARLFLEVDGRPLAPLAALELGSGRALFELPAGLLDGRELSYRAEIRDGADLLRLPAGGVWRVALAPLDEMALVTLLSEPEAASDEPALLAFSAADPGVDLSSASLFIDGQPASGELEADAWLLTWRGQLPAGQHAVELRLKDGAGRELQPQRMVLTVLDARGVPTGREFSAWEEFNMDYLDSREAAQWQRYHAGQARFRMWRGRGEEAWTLKGRVLLSGQDVESDDLQPQSRVNLDLTHKGFLLGVGDRQPEYSPLLLSGTRVRGGELGLEFRPFGLRLVGGHSVEARDPRFGSMGEVDFAGAYARSVIGMDLRLGRRGGLVEGGLTVLKAKDDEGSIRAEPPASWGADSLARISPEDNFGLGARLHVSALRGRFNVRNEVAFTLHNSDIRGGAWTKADLDSLGAGDLPDPSSFEDVIVINQYFSPLDLVDGDILTATAFSSNWQWIAGPNELSADLRRVGGAFRSLGNSFLTPDQQELRVSDRVRLLRNQLYLDVAAGLTTDNLDGQYDATVGTTSRQLASLGLGWYPRGRDLQVRLGFEQQQEANEALDILPDGSDEAATLDARSQHIDGTLQQLRLGVSGTLDWLARRHQWSLNLVSQGYGDDEGTVAEGADVLRLDRSYSSFQAGLGWKTELPARLRLDSGFTLYNSDYDERRMTDYGYWSLRAALGRDWLAGRLTTSLRTQFQDVSTQTAGEDGAFTRLDLGAESEWTIRPGMALAGRVDWQGWSGDRDDSFIKVVARLTQEF